ncbi:hypothetical protein HCB46_13410 [Listeria ivanovii]|uniref:hypothetical protein n=1 Tax=Listeria ivanovii TaxID=1638 RepID=UPI0016275874|nr:hypothetical protein [Listeria ivanovii]MBC2256445.1 hypothetical protein [Listeria ivanovii]
MENISKIFEALKNINKENNFNLISHDILEEQSDNINDISGINERLNHILENLAKLQDKESLGDELVELHLVVGEVEWQYDQLHDIVRHVIAMLNESEM